MTSVSGPAGGATLSYQQRNLITNFYSNTFGQQMTVQGLPPVGYSGYPSYFALTSVGAQQSYQFSYSDYGMAYSFTMGGNATVTFDYATSGSTQLGGAPAFTQRTETSGTVQGTYSYSVGTTVTTITRPDTSTLTLTDNGSGLLAQSEIKKGTQSFAKMVYTYGADPGGAQEIVTAKSYDDTGTPRRIDYGYDQYGNVTSKLEYGFQVNGPWMRKTTLTYQGAPYTTSFMRDLVNGANIYDPNNNQVAGTSYSYDGYGSILSYSGQSTAPGHLSNYDSSYTLRGNVTGVTRLTDVAHGLSTSRGANYDVFGNQIQIDLDCCHQKTFTYNQDTYWSQPDQTISGSGSTTLTNSSVYNFNTSATTSRTDPNGLTTNVTSNSWLQPTQINPPGGASFGLGYGGWGDLNATSVSYTDGGVNKSFSASVTKDGWGNPIQQFDPYGNQINLSYDSMGQLSSKTNPFPKNGTPGPATTYQHDTLGRTTAVTLPNNQTINYAFSSSTVTITDQVGRRKQQQQDGLGRQTITTEPDPATGQLTLTTSYSYDLLDDLIQVNQGGQIRSFKYDAAKRLIYERLPEQIATINDGTGTVWTCAYTYTNFDAESSRTDARGVVTTFGYDSMNRLVSRSYNISNAPGVEPTNNVTWTYDTSNSSSTKGLLLSVTMTGTLPTYQESLSYDSFNRLSSRTSTFEGQSYTVRYQYNNIRQLTQFTYPSGRFINVGHDSVGRMASLVDGSGPQYLSSLTFNSNGFLSGDRLGNGVSQSFGYDSQTLQLISRTATAPGGAAGGLMNLNYSYQALAGQLGVGTTVGNAGLLVSISNSSIGGVTESAGYTYDLLGRVITSSQTSNGSTAQRRFGYDKWANRTGEWDATSGGNQLQSVAIQQSGGAPTNRIQSITASGNTLNYSYDTAGNLTSDGVHSYQYDGENRLRTIDGGSTAVYGYDSRNCRIKKAIGSSVIHYVWESGQVLSEHSGTNGAVLVDYVSLGGGVIAEVAGGVTRYSLSDRLSLRMVLDAGGNSVGRQSHLPFGEDFAESGPQEKHHFTTYERDSESGSDYALNRVYAASTGRFLSVDPYRGSAKTEDPQSWNRYAYVAGEPVNTTDPTGLGGCPSSACVWFDGHCLCPPGDDGGSGGGSGGCTFIARPGHGRVLTDTCGGGEGGGGGGSDPDPMEVISTAFNNVIAVLAKDQGGTCAMFLGPHALEALNALAAGVTVGPLANPLTGIEQQNNRRHPEVDHQDDDGVIIYRSFGIETFNEFGPFFDTQRTDSGHVGERLPQFGGYDAGSAQAQVLMIIHELAHMITMSGGQTYLIPDDGGNAQLSEANTALIKSKCGDAIKAVLGGN